MKTLTSDQFEALIDNAKILEEDGYGLKVLRLSDGTFLKLFRRKRWLSSALIYPYSRRFASNAEKLTARNIHTVRVIERFRLQNPERECVHYHPLPGVTLRDLYRQNHSPMSQDLVQQLGHYIAELHQKGVYFRSIHLGNLVQTPNGDLGIIDISDMKIFNGPLRDGLRIRNFAHLIKGKQDQENLDPNSEAGQQLIDSYCSATRPLKPSTIAALKTALGMN
ncbi:hypothetical protein MIB92_08070 [Aestuariirhabdus sp. Z084]|uniref:hypothetical protein n=1 Tax=Aestuariirhabdus haliotis TaxID=2918751 RepID=UPI00201B3907|nr:hypothetical protein [Aestuariirhabdus haliotis]MCL6415603.1 hypothetical protein [Aestuariirhabdus haliotis]MCL6419598.1 hypothetical protein [Aestuariirhabdus haliotis]